MDMFIFIFFFPHVDSKIASSRYIGLAIKAFRIFVATSSIEAKSSCQRQLAPSIRQQGVLLQSYQATSSTQPRNSIFLLHACQSFESQLVNFFSPFFHIGKRQANFFRCIS